MPVYKPSLQKCYVMVAVVVKAVLLSEGVSMRLNNYGVKIR